MPPKKESIFGLCLFWLLPLCLFGQTPFLPPERLSEFYSATDFLFQDSEGFLWGVQDKSKVIRYDGKNALAYSYDPADSNSISGCTLASVWTEFLEDQGGKIWIRSFFGCLDRFDPETGRFESIARRIHEKVGPLGYCHDLMQDAAGNIWVASTSLGALRIDPSTWKIDQFQPDRMPIRLIFEDTDGGIWASVDHDEGPVLRKLNVETGQYEDLIPLAFPGNPGSSLTRGDIAVEIGDTGEFLLLISHFLFRFDPQSRKVFAIPTPFGPNGRVLSLIGQGKSFYVDTGEGRIYQIEPPDLTFQLVYESDEKQFDLVPPLGAGLVSRDGVLWASSEKEAKKLLPRLDRIHSVALPASIPGLAGQGLYRGKSIFKFQGKVWLNSFPYPTLLRHGRDSILELPIRMPGAEKDSTVQYQFETDPDGNLWIVGIRPSSGSEREIFLRKISPEGKVSREYKGWIPPPALRMPTSNFSAIQADGSGGIWLSSVNQLWKIDPDFDLDYPFVLDTIAPKKGFLRLFVDRQKNLWTLRCKRDYRTGQWSDIDLFPVSDPGQPNSINSMLQDLNGNYWFGTNAGVVKWDPNTGKLQRYLEKDGLTNIRALKLFEDARKNVWVITGDRVISKYIPEWDHFACFSGKEGIRLRSEPNEILIDDDGWVYIRVNHWFVHYFHPDSLKIDTIVPKVHFTGLELFNTFVKPGDSTGLLQKTLDFTESITLKYAQNDFSIHYTAPEYIYNEDLVFTIQLEGFQDDWQEVGSKREARFTNLSPGRYTFKVKVRNHHGFWSETPSTLQIRVLPPWYRTPWAYALWISLILGTIYAVYRYQLRRRLAIAEARQLKELDQAKTRLYTNITHEFRTPLTVILGMAEQVKSDPKNWFNEGLRLIGRNGKHLLHLVNQLLDLSKLESGSMPLNLVHGDVISYLQYLTESFYSYADSKDIRLHFQTDLTALEMDHDPEKLQHIVSNLLSNAIKFTPAGGDVYVQVSASTDLLHLRVVDNGPGIAPEHLPHIFDRFYQADTSATRRGEGTGIGLALTKELVKVMGGEIEVESTVGKGTKFSIQLPVTHTAQAQPSPAPELSEALLATALVEEESPAAVQPVEPSDRYTVLLVEDNQDVITYLSSILSLYYRVETARNGKEGIAKALEITPDLIVSDVMMPDTDGFELTETLKTDERSSHIPIILLTAKADQASKVEGLTYGADAYLTKPFHKEELLVRVEKLIEQRRKLQEKYQQAGSLRPLLQAPVAGIDDTFLQKAVRHIETHLSDEEYGMPQLCKAMNMSRSNLFRKLKALTGKSATDLIRSMRLEKAKELLETTEMSVSEVCYAVGFNNTSYFSTAFREAYGLAPSEVRG